MTWLDFLIIKVSLFAVNYSQSLDSALTVLTNDLRSLFIRAVTNTLMQSMKSRGPSTELCSTPQGVLALLKIHEINHIWTTEIKWKWRNDRRGERNLCNCVKKAEKIQDFNGVWTHDLAIPVWCSTNWAMTPLTLGAGQDTRYAGDTWDLGTHLPGSQSLWEFLRSQYWDCYHSILSWMICLAQLQCKHTILSTYADDTQIF